MRKRRVRRNEAKWTLGSVGVQVVSLLAVVILREMFTKYIAKPLVESMPPAEQVTAMIQEAQKKEA